MPRLIRSSRIGGSGTKTRRGELGRTLAAALAAAIAVLAMGGVSSLAPSSAAFAQTAGTAGPVSLGELFDGEDSVGLTPDGIRKLRDAAQKARDQGNCPKGTFTVVVKKGDDLFQGALATARRDAMTPILGDQARNFVFEIDFKGVKNDVRVDYGVPRDTIAPALDVTWTPPKGTKVRVGTRITAKAVARDDANRWQSGIKTIDLDVRGGGQFGFGDYPRPPQTCERPPPAQTLDGVYTVRANPPPIVRLRARASDFAGHFAQDIADFPTGDWYGRFEWKHACQGSGTTDVTRGVSDLTLDHDGHGNLTGRLAGSTPERSQTMPTCSFRYVAPGTFSAKLIGSYTSGQDAFSAQAVEVRTTPGRASWTCPAATTVTEQAFFTVYEGPMFRNAFRDLRRQPDGSRKSSGENTFSAGGSTCTTTYSLTLRQARN
jgi:hypothetical protein